MSGRYLDLDLPDYFALEIRDEQGNWLTWNVYESPNFERLEDGTYVCGSIEGSSPTWLRCVAHHDGWFEHIDQDGRGDVFAYRIVPLDPNAI
jgi:hypothetical protein